MPGSLRSKVYFFSLSHRTGILQSLQKHTWDQGLQTFQTSQGRAGHSAYRGPAAQLRAESAAAL